MTSSIQPTISPTDRVAPQRGARTPKPQPAKARSAPTRRPWLAATILSVGTLAVVGGGFVGWQMLTTGEVPKPRMAAIKLGPLPEMPDLRDGVPALIPSRSTASAVKPTTPQPNAAQADDANRKAMASTVAAANLRPALAAVPAIRAEAEMPKPAAAPVSATAAVVAAEPAPVRQVDVKRPTETASIGVDAKAPVATLPASVATQSPTPVAATPAPVPRPVEAAREPAPAAQPRVASLPVDAPLPPRKPSIQAPEAAQERAAERPAAPKPRPVAAQPRPAAPSQAVASAEPRAPAPSAVEEERSILGVPVPRFVPTGRDIRDAAASVGNAITSIPDNF